jgi:PPOX class probable F420-dependent enzyme
VPRPPLPANLVEILQRPNPAVMATVRQDGAPVSVATWYLWEDDRILVNLDAARRRLEHIRTNPWMSITVLDGDSWYRHISLRGKVSTQPDPDLADIDRIATHYTGKPYANRERARVSAWMDVSTYHVWGF